MATIRRSKANAKAEIFSHLFPISGHTVIPNLGQEEERGGSVGAHSKFSSQACLARWAESWLTLIGKLIHWPQGSQVQRAGREKVGQGQQDKTSWCRPWGAVGGRAELVKGPWAQRQTKDFSLPRHLPASLPPPELKGDRNMPLRQVLMPQQNQPRNNSKQRHLSSWHSEWCGFCRDPYTLRQQAEKLWGHRVVRAAKRLLGPRKPAKACPEKE